MFIYLLLVFALSFALYVNFKKVLELLERHDIMNEKFRIKAIARGRNFFEYKHEILIEGYKVKAILIKDPLSGELFLNNAWVVTK